MNWGLPPWRQLPPCETPLPSTDACALTGDVPPHVAKGKPALLLQLGDHADAAGVGLCTNRGSGGAHQEDKGGGAEAGRL